MAERLTLERWLALDEGGRKAALADLVDRDAALVSLGDECERMAATRVAVAVEALEQLVGEAESNGRGKSRLLRALTTALAYAGRHEESLAAARAAMNAADEAGLAVERARAAVASLHPLTKLGRIDEALAVGNGAREALLAAGEPKLAARADINLGNIRKSTGHVAEALEHLERARTLLADDLAMAAHAENTLGETHLLRDDFAAARQAFRSAAAHFTTVGQGFAGAIVEGNLADLAGQEGRLQEALKHFESARSSLEKDTARGHLARLTAEEAEVLASLGAPQEALRGLDHAIELLESLGSSTEAARARLARARVTAGLGRLDQARDDAAVAEQSAASRGDVWVARLARLLLAELSLATEPTKALSLATSVAEDASTRGLERIVARHHAARAFLLLKNPVAARQQLDAAITEARELGHRPLLSDLLVARATAASSDAATLTDLLEAVELIEEVRASLTGVRVRANWTGSRLKAFESLALAYLGQSSPEGAASAFDAAERSKSRSLLDLVQRVIDRQSKDPDEAATDDLREEFERLRRHLGALYGRWESEGSPGERRSVVPTAQLRRTIRDGEARLERLAQRLAARDGRASLWARPLGAKDVQQRLAPNEALVEYFLADEELLAFVVKRDGIGVVRRLATASEAMSLSTAALFQMRRATRLGAGDSLRSLVATQAALGAMHRTLIAPIEVALGDVDSLVVVPHGPLHGVPFHALYDDRSGSYLVDRTRVRTAPSATLAHAAAHETTRPQQVLVVGVSDHAAPAIVNETHLVGECWPDAKVLGGPAATADRVLAAAPHARIVHLACHGRFSESMPNASGLRLADRWISIREITELSLRADLVVLAGCETGRAAIEPGDEAVGLPRAFIAAGASSVIMSLWPVRDESALRFMTLLHQQLAAGAPSDGIGAAVRETMRTVRTTEPHPASWGAFGLFGGDPWATLPTLASPVGRTASL
jgi:CHAT domain-containing protein